MELATVVASNKNRLRSSERLGIALTEGYMMDPEASVSALVFHHPAAKYFKAVD